MTPLYASFDDASSAEKAAGALLDRGVRHKDLSVISSRADGQHVVSTASGITTTTGADAAVVSSKGAEVGLGAGVLVGLASIFVPGFGLVVGGGALATAIAAAVGTGVAGAVVGGLTGYLEDQGVPDEAAMHYHHTIQNGGALLSVTVPSGTAGRAEVEDVLSKYGARNIASYDQAALVR